MALMWYHFCFVTALLTVLCSGLDHRTCEDLHCSGVTRCVMHPLYCKNSSESCDRTPRCVKIDCSSFMEYGTGHEHHMAWCHTGGGHCEQFDYSGEGGNEDVIFTMKTDCEDTCTIMTADATTDQWVWW